MKKLNNKKGFTLMEMLIVVAIIAVLVAIAIPVFNGALTKSKEAADVANIRAYYAELQIKAIDEGKTAVSTAADGAAFVKEMEDANYDIVYDTKVKYDNGTITYEATKLADKNGAKTYTWKLGDASST